MTPSAFLSSLGVHLTRSQMIAVDAGLTVNDTAPVLLPAELGQDQRESRSAELPAHLRAEFYNPEPLFYTPIIHSS